MEKIDRLEDDPSSLTSFNFIPEGDEEGLISKIFSKFKTAVSGPNQQIISPSSSTRTISIILSNESGMITDQVVPEQHFVTMEKTQSNTTVTSSSAMITDTITPSSSVIAGAVATGMSTATESNTSNTLSLPIHTQNSTNTNNYASTATTANTASSLSLPSIPKQDKDVSMKKSKPTVTNKDPSSLSSSLTTPTIIKTTTSTPAASQPKHKHIIIDEDQNQQQQIPSSMLIPLTKTSSIDSDTQSVMTTFSVSNTNSLSRILNRLRGGESLDSNKDFWMPDEQCKECNNCNAPFNLFRRKHHCRTCGKVLISLIYLCF